MEITEKNLDKVIEKAIKFLSKEKTECHFCKKFVDRKQIVGQIIFDDWLIVGEYCKKCSKKYPKSYGRYCR